jgi:TolB-like protein/Flp pilus assembly protein TadD
VATAARAVFLSYASQDANAARQICDALRAEGIEVWFDQSELRGGDAWDRAIRRQIKNCALFIPVISRNTHERDEGYFRLEWKLAVDRSHLMTGNKAFLLPVVIDDTRDDDENVPDRFREVQWTRLAGGQTPGAFVDRVQRLLSPVSATSQPPMSVAPGTTATHQTPARTGSWWSILALGATVAVLAFAALAHLVGGKFWISKHVTASPTVAATAPATPAPAHAAFSPPQHSVAVLPFVNMSGDKDQEYFSDGLTEEILNSLARINELQVSARTSSFSFKGKDADISIIAHKLNVASVLEGSVRRAGNTVRVTAQLNNAVTGFHLWSQTYDRDLSNVLQLQTEIANAVANALKVTLLGDVAAKIEVGGTRNPSAFDAYLRAEKAYYAYHDAKEAQKAIDIYTEAIQLDPDYALAYAARSIALNVFATELATGLAVRNDLDNAKTDALKALTLAPELADGHLALASVYATLLDFTAASQEFERALTLGPGNARVLRAYGRFAVLMGRGDPGLTAVRQAVVLDPLNKVSHLDLGATLYFLRHYEEARVAFTDALALDPANPDTKSWAGFTYFILGDLERARLACESTPETDELQYCLAVVYNKLGRQADAQAMLEKIRTQRGDNDAYQYTVIYAQWGDNARALDWLETGMRLRRPWLYRIKKTPLLDPLRKEPRYQAIERELKFPPD